MPLFHHRLGVSYVDLYLIHHPKPGRNIESYKAMMKLKEQGRIKYVTLQCMCSFAFVVSCFCFEGFVAGFSVLSSCLHENQHFLIPV